MKWIVLSYSESYFEETKYILVKFYQFSCNQAFENAYESYINFQPLLYAKVPTKSPSYAPTIFTFYVLLNSARHACLYYLKILILIQNHVTVLISYVHIVL